VYGTVIIVAKRVRDRGGPLGGRLKSLLVLEARRSGGTGSAESFGLAEWVGGRLRTGLDVACKVSEDVGVQDLGTSSSGQEEPDGENGLEDKVQRKPVEDEAEHHRFTEVQGAEDDPVCEPLLVIVGARALNSLDGEVRGQSPSDDVGNRLSEAEHVEEDQDDRGSAESENTVCLWDPGPCLEVSEHGVLAELGIERADLSRDKLVCLLGVRVLKEVLLNLLRLRHIDRCS